ncbi:MAG: ribonuclease HII [Candidatus Izemoplasmataceae bacterium]
MYKYEETLLSQGHLYIAGCDEVGRGPLAGPVVASAVILDPKYTIVGLNDSKKLSEKKRNELYQEILQHALAIKTVFIEAEEIDRINIYQASKKAMIDAINDLEIKPTYILSDAMPLSELGIPYESIIKGDTKSATIAAASIVAKVVRDQYMVDLAKEYPDYGFERHKGYPTKAHKEALIKYGITPYHRKSYAPVQDVIYKQQRLKII